MAVKRGSGRACVPASAPHEGASIVSGAEDGWKHNVCGWQHIIFGWKRRYADVRAGTQAPPLPFQTHIAVLQR